MDKKQKIRVVVIFPTLIVVVILSAVVYFVLQAGAVTSVEPSAAAHEAMTHVTTEHAADNTMPEVHEAMENNEEEALSCAFDFLIGLDAGAAVEQILPLGRPYRVLGPGDAATMDFVEERINLQTDDTGIVVAVTCG